MKDQDDDADLTLMFFRQKDKVKRLEDDLASLKRMVDSNMNLASISNSRNIVENHLMAKRFNTLFYFLIAGVICNSFFFIHHFIHHFFLGGR